MLSATRRAAGSGTEVRAQKYDGTSTGPVSYTHLDVYKRQEQLHGRIVHIAQGRHDIRKAVPDGKLRRRTRCKFIICLLYTSDMGSSRFPTAAL